MTASARWPGGDNLTHRLISTQVGGERNPQCSGSAPQDDVEKLGVHPESDGWAVISDLPDERFRNAAVVVEGWLYIFGGQQCINQIVAARHLLAIDAMPAR